jgi:molybdopterin converting factor small subunit
VKVLIPAPLHAYTRAPVVSASGSSLEAVLVDLDRQFPGLRSRVQDEQGRLRRHLRFFVNGEQVFDLTAALGAEDELLIVQALSGG